MLRPEALDHEADVRLARRAAAGDSAAWHAFVEGHSRLIFAVVRRYFAAGDDEDRRNAYVHVLEHFYRAGLSKYDGRSSLSTWVTMVSRTRCLDLLRGSHGRKRPPAWLRRLPARHREVYRRYFLNGENYPAIAAAFALGGAPMGFDEFRAVLDRLEASMDARLRTQIAYDLRARSLGNGSGHKLAYLDQLSVDMEATADSQRPDIQFFHARARETLQRVRNLVRTLDDQEEKVVRLYFYEGQTAAGVARQLGLRNQRRAYTLLASALRSLRRGLERSPGRGDAAAGDGEAT